MRREHLKTPSFSFDVEWEHLDPLVYVVPVAWVQASALQQQQRVLSEVWPILAFGRAFYVVVSPGVRAVPMVLAVLVRRDSERERQHHHGHGIVVGFDGRQSHE